MAFTEPLRRIAKELDMRIKQLYRQRDNKSEKDLRKIFEHQKNISHLEYQVVHFLN